MKFYIIFGLSFILLSCSSTISVDSIDQPTIWSNGKNEIQIGASSISLNDKNFELRNCSNENKFCYSNDDLEFVVDVPKSCSIDMWSFFRNNSPWEFFTLIPHKEEALYKVKGSDIFLFDYSQSNGITSIYYKDEAGFEIPKNKDELENFDFSKITNFVHPVLNGEGRFKCEKGT